MASVSSTIEIVLEATTRGFRAATAAARAAMRGLSDDVERFRKTGDGASRAVAGLSKSLLAIGTVGNVIAILAAVTAALAQLAPVVLLLPGILLGAAAAFAVVGLATAGFSEALSAADPAAFAEATKDMAPAARDAASAIREFRAPLADLRRSVQGEFFAGFSDQIRELGTKTFPTLNAQLPRIAAGFNAMGRELLSAFSSLRSQEDIGLILANTADGLAQFAPVLANLATGFLRLGAAGSNYLARIGTGIADSSANFLAFTERITGDGSFERWVDRALVGFRDLGTIVGNVGAILGDVFGGLAAGAGQNVLATLAQTTTALRELVAAAESQAALAALGETLRVIAEVTRTVVLVALQELGSIMVAIGPAAQEVARGFGDFLVNGLRLVGPLLAATAGFLSEHREVLGTLAPVLLGVVLGFKGLSILLQVAAWIRAATIAVGGLAAALRLVSLVGLAVVATEINKINIAAAGGEENLTGLAENLNDLVGAGREIATLNFAGIFSEIGEEFRAAADGGFGPAGAAIRAVGTAITDTVAQAQAGVGQFVAVFAAIPGQVSGALATFGASVQAGIGVAVDFVVAIPERINTALVGLAGLLGARAAEAGAAFTAGVTTTLDQAVAFFADLPFRAGFALGALVGTLARIATEAGTALVTAVTERFNAAVAIATALPGQIGGALAALPGQLGALAQAAGTALLNAVTERFNAAVAFVSAIPGRVGAALSSLVGTTTSTAQNAGNGFTTATTSAFNQAVAFVAGVPGRIGAAISSVVGIVVAQARAAGAGFVSGITASFNAAVSFVSGIPGRIRGAIGNLGGLLVGAGRAVIDGLLAGIRAGYNNMINFVSGIAAGIAANKGPLAYDRTVLIPAGLALMSGLLSGLRTGNAEVQRWTDGVAGGLADTLSGALSAPLGRVNLSALGAMPAGAATATQIRDAARAATAPGATYVTVKIGDQELRGLIETVVERDARAVARTVRAGAGATY